MPKSSAQLNREIAEALARGPRTAGKRREIKIYGVNARIVSGIDDEDVWEGSFEVPASSLQAAHKLSRDLLHESPYYDPRIDPAVALDRVEHVGEVEVSPSETPEQTAAMLIAKVRSAIS